MRRRRLAPLVINNADIDWLNFEGAEKRFNAAGERNFCVFFDDPDLVQSLIDDGWNVRFTKPAKEGDEPEPYLQVKVNFRDNVPEERNPQIFLYNKHGKAVQYTEETVHELDNAILSDITLVITPSFWEVSGKSGYKAYLAEMTAVISPRITSRFKAEDPDEEE